MNKIAESIAPADPVPFCSFGAKREVPLFPGGSCAGRPSEEPSREGRLCLGGVFEPVWLVRVVSAEELLVRRKGGTVVSVRLLHVGVACRHSRKASDGSDPVWLGERRSCFEWQMARLFVEGLVSPGTLLWLQCRGSNRDVRGSLLRYVWLALPPRIMPAASLLDEMANSMLNALLIRCGYAVSSWVSVSVSSSPAPHLQPADCILHALLDLETRARDEGRGIMHRMPGAHISLKDEGFCKNARPNASRQPASHARPSGMGGASVRRSVPGARTVAAFRGGFPFDWDDAA